MNDLQRELRTKFERLRDNRWAVAATTARERSQKLARLREAVLAKREELCEALYADFRKHRAEVEITELQAVVNEINHAAANVARWMRPVRVKTPILLAGTRSELHHEPKGVALILSPWNYPFNLLVDPLVAAVAAGNCVFLKPSEKVPNTAAFLADLIPQVFDENEVAIALGGPEVAQALLDLPFDHIFFTGSTAIGRKVMEAAAKHLASVTLELGGKSPVIVDETADIAAAAERVVWGKFINAGQTCIAPDYVLVHESKQAKFLERACSVLDRFYGRTDDDRRRSPDFCRLVDSGRYGRIVELLGDAIERGAKVETGGHCVPEERYVSPTVLSSVDPKSMLMLEEFF